MRKQRRYFTDEFKQQMVNLYHSGKPKTDIVKEYDLTHSSLDRWIQQAGSFKHKDNLSPEEKKILEQEKEIKQLRMENDILKQATLIMGRK